MSYNRGDSQSSNSDDMDILLSLFDDWKEAIVHFDGALNWENPKVLLYIFSFVNIVFAFYWYTEPSFLMTLGFLGIFISSADYFGPKLLQRYNNIFNYILILIIKFSDDSNFWHIMILYLYLHYTRRHIPWLA